MFCPKCARSNSDQNKFCNGCGASLLVEMIPLPAPPPPPIKIKTAEVLPVKSVTAEILPEKVDGNLPVIDFRSEETGSEVLFTADEKKEKLDFDLSKVINEAEILLDEILPDNRASKSTEKLVDLPQKEDNSISDSNLSENSSDYLSEIESKYRNFQPEISSGYKRSGFIIIGGIALAAVIIFGGLFRYLSGQNDSDEKIIADKNSAQEKNSSENPTANINQPPSGMAFVPGGEFMMGSDSGDEFSRPAHKVSVKPFYIDLWEVTCEEYRKFIEATGHAAPRSWNGSNFPDGAARKPVTGVNWDDANAFAKWKNKRLPTEEEWEFAARGTDGRIYPWGNEWKPEMANAGNQKSEVQEIGLAKGASPFGVFDLSGNAWEWTASDAQSYPNGKSFEKNTVQSKVIRGGYFGSAKVKAITTFRRAYYARNEDSYDNTGFRCVADLSADQNLKTVEVNRK